MLNLSEKYFISMLSYLKTLNYDIFESKFPIGILIAIMYELLQDEKIEIKGENIAIVGDRESETQTQKIIMDALAQKNGQIGFVDLLSELYFSIEKEYVKDILYLNEKNMTEQGLIKKEKKKFLFLEKAAYTIKDDVISGFSQEIAESPNENMLGYLLLRFGLLERICKKELVREVKDNIKNVLKQKDGFLSLADASIACISSTLATSGVMM